VANSTAPSPAQHRPAHGTILPKGRAAMEDTEDTSSVRISSFQPQATQNYIAILSLYQDAARLTPPFNNAADFKKGICFFLFLLELVQICHTL
jgi:hypothetical protein